MSKDLPRLHQRREQILQEMGAIDQLCRGHLSEQFFKSKQGGRTVRRGPYYVLQRWFGGKNLCERVPADLVEPIRKGVQGYKRFRQLADEFVDVCEQITLQTGDLPALKKKRVWPSSKSSSGKPPVS
jgi:transposase